MTKKEFQQIIKGIPNQPGIYKYLDKDDTIIYIGKAKNLRKRVSSYFIKKQSNYKTYELVNRINRIEFTVVNSEQDAFLLENSLIKKFQPRYNIDLKDDKSFPFIVIKKEPYPRVFLTRRKTDDGSEYLGPFTSVQKVRELLTLIKQNIQLRTCTLPLTKNNIEKKKFKVCLEYHLGNCKGPCEGLQTENDYQEGLLQIKNLLKGNLGPVLTHFKTEMKALAQKLDFEKAERIKKKIEHLENYQVRSVIVNKKLTNVDVFSIIKEEDVSYINYLMIQNGTIVQTKSIKVVSHLGEEAGEILSFAAERMRNDLNSAADEIIVPFPVDLTDENIIITIPRAGDKKKLLELSEKNAEWFARGQKQKAILNTGGNSEMLHVLEMLQKDLQLNELPAHIECFDNSNFQGAYPVSAMVCYKDGVPSKKDYRHFNVKTVSGINDFATMKEAVYRRYKRILEEDQPFPQLIIIDGGKGQLSASIEALDELNATGLATIIGLAKNTEEIFFAADSEPLKLSYKNEAHQLLRRIRDEVHRFGITFHRKKRSKGTFKNELNDIAGIGPKTAELLLKKFKSVKNIKAAGEVEIENIIGKKRTAILIKHFSK